MKHRRFSLEVRPGAVVLLSGLYFLLPLRWCARLALTVTVHELGHVAALILCGAQVCGLRMEGARSRRRWQARPPVRGCFAFCAGLAILRVRS